METKVNNITFPVGACVKGQLVFYCLAPRTIALSVFADFQLEMCSLMVTQTTIGLWPYMYMYEDYIYMKLTLPRNILNLGPTTVHT